MHVDVPSKVPSFHTSHGMPGTRKFEVQAARRQVLALCPTSLRMLNGSLIAGKEHHLLSLLKHQSNSSVHPALLDSHIHAARSKSARPVRSYSFSSSASAVLGSATNGPGAKNPAFLTCGISGSAAGGVTGTAAPVTAARRAASASPPAVSGKLALGGTTSTFRHA